MRVESSDADARSATTTAVLYFILSFAITGCRYLWNLANRDLHNEARSRASSDTYTRESMSNTYTSYILAIKEMIFASVKIILDVAGDLEARSDRI